MSFEALSFYRRAQKDHSSDCGFTLVELLVVVSIVAILSVSSVIGFGSLGETLRARESAGFISDTVKQEELKVLRGDFEKAVIHFLKDYMVIEEWPTGATEDLKFLEVTCATGDYQIEFATTASGNLTQKDGDGVVLEVKPVVAPNVPVCPSFKTSHDVEWNYQLANADRSSAIVRFVHFNLQRDGIQEGLSLKSGDRSKVEIFAPYGRKRFFKWVTEPAPPHLDPSSSLVITVGNADTSVNEAVTLQ